MPRTRWSEIAPADYAFGCVMTLLVAAVVAICFYFAGQPPLKGAPVARPVEKKLTAADMVGRWRFEWGQQTDGWIEFQPDGRYQSRHDAGSGPDWFLPRHAGLWEASGGVILLTEGYIVEGEALNANRTYLITVTTKNWPVIDGEYGITKVRFSKHPR